MFQISLQKQAEDIPSLHGGGKSCKMPEILFIFNTCNQVHPSNSSADFLIRTNLHWEGGKGMMGEGYT